MKKTYFSPSCEVMLMESAELCGTSLMEKKLNTGASDTGATTNFGELGLTHYGEEPTVQEEGGHSWIEMD